uniref:Uncharacterized protein n=2 Tax=Ixodes scapularis TaxID=6945 RepID=A0A1S4L748_IXOSC
IRPPPPYPPPPEKKKEREEREREKWRKKDSYFKGIFGDERRVGRLSPSPSSLHCSPIRSPDSPTQSSGAPPKVACGGGVLNREDSGCDPLLGPRSQQWGA